MNPKPILNRTIRVFVAAVMLAGVVVTLQPTAPARAATINVDTYADELDGGAGNSSCSLREALANANYNNSAQADCNPGAAGADDIIIGAPTDGDRTISLVAGTWPIRELRIIDSVNFRNNSGGVLTIDAQNAGRIFNATQPNLTITFDRQDAQSGDIYLQNGAATAAIGVDGTNGGCIKAQSNTTLSLDYTHVLSSHADANGGGIACGTGCTITLRNDSLITSNTANSHAGGVSMAGGSFDMSSGQISSNTADNDGNGIGNGGGIYATGTDIDIAGDASITSNSAGGDGGAIYLRGTTALPTPALDITRVRFQNNTADADSNSVGNGGAICAALFNPGVGGPTLNVNITRSYFEGNSADARGGAIYFRGNGGDLDATITYSLFEGNSLTDVASGNGGAISFDDYADDGTNTNSLDISYSTLYNNTAPNEGGAIWIYSTDNRINGSIWNSTITDNTATNGNGGGVWLDVDWFSIYETTFAYNDATNGSGGGVYGNLAGIFTGVSLFNDLFAYNTAGTAGPDCDGGFQFEGAGGYTTLIDSWIMDATGCVSAWAGNGHLGTGLIADDPLLDPLADNGGTQTLAGGSAYTYTPTHALQPTSPAIDYALAGVSADDQRGIARPQGTNHDPGAYEATLVTINGQVFRDLGGLLGGLFCGIPSDGIYQDGIACAFDREWDYWHGDITVNLYVDDGDGVFEPMTGDGPAIASTSTVAGGVPTAPPTGTYTFSDAPTIFPIDYWVEFDLSGATTAAPMSYFLTLQDQGADDTADSDANRADGSVLVTFNASGTVNDIDAGVLLPVVILSNPARVLSEGGSSLSYTVVLGTAPIGNVQIDVTHTNDDGDVTDTGNVPPTNLAFNSTTWNTPQTFTVQAVDDAIDEVVESDETHTHTVNVGATSNEFDNALFRFGTLTGPIGGFGSDYVRLWIIDNDTAGVIVTESGGDTQVSEDGATDSYTVELTSQPLNTVTITVAADAQIDIRDADVGGAYGKTVTLTFDPSCSGASGCWDYVYTIDVIGTDDSTCETNPHFGLITHSAISADAAYNGVAIVPVQPIVTENDVCDGGGGGGGGGGAAAYDPAISKAGDPANAVPGETVVWTLTIWNPGGDTLHNVSVNDPIPGMFDIVDVDTPVGTATVSGQVVTITIPSLAPGQSFDATITTVANDLAVAGEVCNVAYVGGAHAEACVTMYPGLLPETGGEPVGVVVGVLSAAAVVGAAASSVVLIHRRRTVAE